MLGSVFFSFFLFIQFLKCKGREKKNNAIDNNSEFKWWIICHYFLCFDLWCTIFFPFRKASNYLNQQLDIGKSNANSIWKVQKTINKRKIIDFIFPEIPPQVLNYFEFRVYAYLSSIIALATQIIMLIYLDMLSINKVTFRKCVSFHFGNFGPTIWEFSVVSCPCRWSMKLRYHTAHYYSDYYYPHWSLIILII